MTVQLDETNHVIWPDDLTPDETSQIYAVAAQPQQHSDHKRTLLKASAAIGAAFLIYQAYMESRLKRKLQGAEDLPPEQYEQVVRETSKTFMPAWSYMVAPAIFSSYLSGVELSGQSVATEELQGLAMRYSWNLGEYLNEKSIDASVRGYQAQMNAGIGSKIALSNVIHAFAVPINAIKALIALWTGKEIIRHTDQKLPSLKKARVDKSIKAQLRQRADTIGDHESFGAQSTGKQLAWSVAQQSGLIPQNATRQWVTADDEKVCAQCGPLNGMEVPISQPFVVDKVKFWAPPLHVNCRCDNKLKTHLASEVGQELWHQLEEHPREEDQDDVAKADWDSREHPRDQRSGQFSRSNRGRLQVIDRPIPQRLDLTYTEPAPAATEPEIINDLTASGLVTNRLKASDLVVNTLSAPDQPVTDVQNTIHLENDLKIQNTIHLENDLKLVNDIRMAQIDRIPTKPPPPDPPKSPKYGYDDRHRVFGVLDSNNRSISKYRKNGKDYISFNHVDLTSDPGTVISTAEEHRTFQLNTWLDDLRQNSDVKGQITLDAPMEASEHGTHLRYLIDDFALREAVEYQERKDFAERNGYRGADLADVPMRVGLIDPTQANAVNEWGYVNSTGLVGDSTLHPSEIADELNLGLLTKAMTPWVIQVDHIRGDMPMDTDGHYVSFMVSDDYEIEYTNRDIELLGMNYPLAIARPRSSDDKD